MTIELKDRRFGRWLVLGLHGHKGNRRSWLCRCDCGQERLVDGGNLRSGVSRSCGCLMREMTVAASSKHGDANRGRKSLEYNTWINMRARCSNPRRPDFYKYGGRGIAVCARWNSYETFLADMGRRPSPRHSLDRIDVDGDYSPENCHWTDMAVQDHNKRCRNSHGVRGVSTCRGGNRFYWRVQRHGIKKHGSESSLEAASAAYEAAARELYPELHAARN